VLNVYFGKALIYCKTSRAAEEEQLYAINLFSELGVELGSGVSANQFRRW